jgi:hypothetical protein
MNLLFGVYESLEKYKGATKPDKARHNIPK